MRASLKRRIAIFIAALIAGWLTAAYVLAPLVWMSHRTWTHRIRPLHRDVRNLRQEIDAHATESFGGMRVVRGFGRSQSETNRFVRSPIPGRGISIGTGAHVRSFICENCSRRPRTGMRARRYDGLGPAPMSPAASRRSRSASATPT